MVGDLEKIVWRNTLEIWRNVVGDLEKPVRRSTLEIWRNVVGDLEKTVRQKTLEIWRNMVGAVMTISYWSSLRSSLELGDRKWRLNHNGDKL